MLIRYSRRFNDSVIMAIPSIGYINGGMILGEISDIHRFSNPNKLLAFASLVTSRLRQLVCPNVNHAYYATLLLMQLRTLLETTQPSRLITMPRGLKSGLTTMLLDIVPANLSESSERCSLTKQNLTSNKRSVYQYRQILNPPKGALLKLPFLPPI